jgi:hypothetical protein
VVAAGEVYRELGEAAWAWVLGQVREADGPWLPEVVPGDGRPAGPGEDRDSLYAGIAGLAPVLAEISQYRALSGAEQVLADGIVARLSVMARTRIEPSLYSGLGGDVTALKLLAPGAERVALARLAELMTPAGWNTTLEFEPGSVAPVTDLVGGAAGVVLAAVWAGGEHARDIARVGGQCLLRAADRTGNGLDWAMLPGWPYRMPNYSHGTAGVATALAVAGAALGRDDFVTAARHGAQHLLAVGSLADAGFVVPHTLPRSSWPVDPVTYTWCHGPAGTSYLFAALAHAGVDTVAGLPVTRLRQQCLHSLLTSGIPQRLRRGFGTTTAAAAAPRDWETSCSMPHKTAPARRQPVRCCRGHRPWQTPCSGAPSATRPEHGGGLWSIARTRHCSRRVPRGCKAPQESPPSSCA